eukprot:scaffold21228_cov140-Isochrysis_galbana.AAC.4
MDHLHFFHTCSRRLQITYHNASIDDDKPTPKRHESIIEHHGSLPRSTRCGNHVARGRGRPEGACAYAPGTFSVQATARVCAVRT